MEIRDPFQKGIKYLGFERTRITLKSVTSV